MLSDAIVDNRVEFALSIRKGGEFNFDSDPHPVHKVCVSSSSPQTDVF